MTGIVLLAAMLGQSAKAPRILDVGGHPSIQTRREVVIRSQAEWDALWRDQGGVLPAPVDFSRETIVGVFLGSKPTPGYAVTIVSAEEQGGVLHIKYRESAPPPGRILAQVITYPYQLVAIPISSAKDVKFEKIP